MGTVPVNLGTVVCQNMLPSGQRCKCAPENQLLSARFPASAASPGGRAPCVQSLCGAWHMQAECLQVIRRNTNTKLWQPYFIPNTDDVRRNYREEHLERFIKGKPAKIASVTPSSVTRMCRFITVARRERNRIPLRTATHMLASQSWP